MLDMAADAMPDPPYLQERFRVEPVKPLVDYTTTFKPAIDYDAARMTKQNNINIGSLSSNSCSASDKAALSHFLWEIEDRDRQRREVFLDPFCAPKKKYGYD